MKEEVYGDLILESKLVDPFSYRGRGRPRKTDYITLTEVQKRVNTARNNIIDKMRFQLNRS